MKEIPQVIYEYIKEPLVRFCVDRNITGNMITAVNHTLTLTLGVYFFMVGEYWAWIAGLAVMVINGVLDFMDGDIAKRTGTVSDFGIWMDSGVDVIIQSCVMGAIGIGCFNMGLNIGWVVLLMIATAASNFVSFNYNQTFGFDSYKGNLVFREMMDKKPSLFNRAVKNIIDPTSSHIGIFLFTYRYFIVAGCLFNVMPQCFVILTAVATVRWLIMFVIYSLHLKECKHLHILTVLSVLDEERQEFYGAV